MLDASLVVACSYASKGHSQGDLAEPCENNAEHTAPVAVVEPHNGSFDCRVVDPRAVHTNPKNGCRRSHCYHSKTAGEAYLDGGMAASRNLQRSSRCFPWEIHEEVPEQEVAPVPAPQAAAVVLVPAFANLISMFRWEVDVLLLVLRPNQKGAVPVPAAARPDTVNVVISLRGVQRSHFDFEHLVRFQT